jgi:hypothetical protein
MVVYTHAKLFDSEVANGISRRDFRIDALRIFLTCWLVFAIHLATNSVREIYPAMAIGDHASFRVDEYAGLHPDLFEKHGFGWHINSNPGASLMAAVPYSIVRPVIDRVVNAVNRSRASVVEPPVYNSPWPMAREFYAKAWKRGLDIKLGLGAIAMQVLCMAPVSACGVIAMYWLLLRFFSRNQSLVFALIYAFGTPVFFRAGYLNQNMLLGHVAFLGLVAIWSSTSSLRYFLAGLAAGFTVVLDYSGVVTLAALGIFAVFKVWGAHMERFRKVLVFGAGALLSLSLLWLYQWQSFGNPFLPAQHWMPAVPGIGAGYQGVGVLFPDLLWRNLADYRYGLFTSCPLLLLAFAAPFVNRNFRRLSASQMALFFVLPAALWLFASSVVYARLQFNTGVRYLTPAIPYLFVLACIPLSRVSARALYFIVLVAGVQSWAMAMYRDVEQGLGVLNPLIQLFTKGFAIPVLTVLSRIGPQNASTFGSPMTPAAIFIAGAALLYGIWSKKLDTPAAVMAKRMSR